MARNNPGPPALSRVGQHTVKARVKRVAFSVIPVNMVMRKGFVNMADHIAIPCISYIPVGFPAGFPIHIRNPGTGILFPAPPHSLKKAR